MTGDEEAFVVWFISAQPAKRQAIISTTQKPLFFLMVFLSPFEIEIMDEWLVRFQLIPFLGDRILSRPKMQARRCHGSSCRSPFIGLVSRATRPQ
jgi:hypothetical protein